jgi:drug/metabolite transporter (DMT)-like permease
MLAGNLWAVLAIGASVMWGLAYAISEKVLRAGVHPSILMVSSAMVSFPLFVMLAMYLDQIKPSMAILVEQPKLIAIIILQALCIVVGGYMVFVAVNMKNATLVNLIEITYPLFTALFAYILLKEVQFNWWTLGGGLVVIAGLGIIFVKS